jgi:alpha-1,2-glucosyltransferase
MSKITPQMQANQVRSLLILLSIGVVMTVLMSMILPMAMIADELFHLSQIALFKASYYSIVPALTMPPTYHFIVGEIASVLGVESFSAIRMVSAGISFIAVILAWVYLTNQKSNFPLLQSLQLLFSPLLWPVYWILYTDIPSLVTTILSLILLVNQRYLLSALVCLMSLCFRQHNIFWVLLVWLIAMDQTGCWTRLLEVFKSSGQSLFQKAADAARKCLASTGVYLIPIVCFMGFIYFNNGIAIGDRQAQQFGGLYPLQIFSCLFVLGLVLLPLHLSNIPKILMLLKKHYWLILLLAALFALYMKTFKIVHLHNFPSDYFLRNWLLYFLEGHFRYKVAAFGLIALSLLSLMVTSLRSRANYWLYPVAVLALLPISLIEQRYYIVPFTLLMLFRKPKGLISESAILIWFVILSAGITWGLATMTFFI